MKKAAVLSIFVIFIAYMLPIATHADFFNSESDMPDASEILAVNIKKSQSERFDCGQSVTVMYNDEVIKMTMDKYLEGVLCSEMPASFPYEALRAQAVAARTYAMYKKRLYEINPDYAAAHKGAELCADYGHCSAYRDMDATAEKIWGKNAAKYSEIIKAAVASTDGQIIEYNSQPIAAVFHAVSEGRTENASDVWGGSVPYLLSVETAGAEDDKSCFAEVRVPLDRFKQVFTEEFEQAKLDDDPKEWFKDSKRSRGGSIITVKVGGVQVSGSKIRNMFSLNSADFTVDCDEQDFIFRTKGRGHGVGMSQYGARRMALDGAGYEQILLTYYSGVKIVDLSQQG